MHLRTIEFLQEHVLLAKILFGIWLIFGVSLLVPVLLVGPSFVLGLVFHVLTPLHFADIGMLVFAWPLALVLLLKYYKNAIRDEIELIERVGPENALWFESLNLGSTKSVVRRTAMSGWDVVTGQAADVILSWFGHRALPFVAALRNGSEEFSSLAWSWFFRQLHALCIADSITKLFLFGVLLRRFLIFNTTGFRLVYRAIRYTFFFLFLLWVAEDAPVANLIGVVASLAQLVQDGDFKLWLEWRLVNLIVQATVWALDATMIGRKFSSVRVASNESNRKFGAVLRDSMMRFSVFITDLGLPHYIRGTRPVTGENLQESLDILKDLGWPVNVDLAEPDLSNPVVAEFKEWIVCGTNWSQGVHNLKLHTDHLLDKLRIGALEFKRTEEYGSIENEIISTSRYFKSPRYDYPDLALDDVWFMVKDTFQHSRLTPFNHIIWAWEKKFGLGAFMRKPGTKSKYRRSDFIKAIGGMAPFKRLWRRTFQHALMITPVSAVSIKGEALPPSKWVEDKVRTIIGTPLVHYIASTIWNYEPNHRFSWVETPTKIGMPLNGYWLSEVFFRHSRCQHHFAGDMSAFDSTLTGKVNDMIKAVRKKGFEQHSDYDRIAHLIDVSYDQLGSQFLNTTTNGNIYRKGTGLTTGHSSTSADNSLGLLILYLMAWKELTGLGAKEFKHYNELSDYGDDHVLSFLATKPAAWNFKNVQKAMARWGVTNRLEASGKLQDIPFLHKHNRAVTNSDRAELAKAGVPVPKRIIFHSKERLVGKMVANIKNFDPKYRAKRLLSYLTLTAHHRDVYDGIHKVLTRSSTMKRALRAMGKSVPTYDEILRLWYKKSPHSVRDEIGEDFEEGEKAGLLYHYGQVGWIEHISGAIAMLPDVLNPAIFNYGYQRTLQTQLRHFLRWPVELLYHQNRFVSRVELVSAFRQSAYNVLDPTLHPMVDAEYDPETLLLRHWLFIFYKSFRARGVSFMSVLSSLARKVNILQFVVNARVNPDYMDATPKLLDLLVIVLLNLVPLSPWAAFLCALQLPRADILIDMIANFFLVSIWQNIPPNYKEVTHIVRQISECAGPVLVESPTGTGKSTTFIKHLNLVVGDYWNKIVVVEPRSVLVNSLVPYVRDTLGVNATGRTTGCDFDPRAKVWYSTPQEVALHWNQMLDPHNLLVIDEAHLGEPFYWLLINYAVQEERPCILLTATPNADILASCKMHIPLQIARLWNVMGRTHESEDETVASFLSSYRKYAADLVNSSWSKSKTLLYYPSIKGGEELGNLLNRRVSFLNSQVQDLSGDVIITTSVADAGITIPSVDTVISSDLDISVVPNAGLSYGRLTDGGVMQRKGRTGRTNNGEFYLFSSGKMPLPYLDDLTLKSESMVAAWLNLGMDPHVIDKYAASHFDKVLSLSREEQAIPNFRENLISNMQVFNDNLEYLRISRQMQEVSGHDGQPSFPFDYTAAGTFGAMSGIPIDVIGGKALSGARAATRLNAELDVDTEVFASLYGDLESLTATKRPFSHLFPNLTEVLPPTFEYDWDEIKALRP